MEGLHHRDRTQTSDRQATPCLLHAVSLWLADEADRLSDGDYAALRVAVAATGVAAGGIATLPESADHANQASAGWSPVALQTWGGRILIG